MTPWTPTAAERTAFVWMQARMVELLLRHDAPRFATTFAEHAAAAYDDARLRPYRERAVLVYLRTELFDSIIPRIKRRLSVAAPREVQVEPLPSRGRIDWHRTATASLRDRPGETPLDVHTRQRRRHFATPENLLTVATVVEYRAAAQRVLDEERARDEAQALRHPLADIVDQCTRELAFLQFAGLLHDAEAIFAGTSDITLDDLEARVTENLLPGRNSAYDDLLRWRTQMHALRLLDRTTPLDAQPMIGADPARDNYLYQIWLFYELAEMLHTGGHLHQWDVAGMTLDFSWGDQPAETYRIRHDQALPGAAVYWPHAPGVRPDFAIERVSRQEVRDDHGALIWREPGYILDAKYYRSYDDDPHTPAGPIKRMLADLQLTSERHGALLFAFHGADTASTSDQEVIAPALLTAQYIPPDVQVRMWRMQPRFTDNAAQVHTRWAHLLNHVHATLQPRIAVRCRGMFLDTLGANAQGELMHAEGVTRRDRTMRNADADDLLVCPKPHIAPWRVDLVSLTQDCCANSALCHIKHYAGARPPQRLVRLEDIATAIARTDTDEGDAIAAATRHVLAITKRYAQLLQPDINAYKRWVREESELEAFDTTILLTETQRETLALARFLWEQIEHIKVANYAGPVLLFTGVLEEITHATIYRYSPVLCDNTGKPLMKTLGTLGQSKGYGGTNWAILDHAIVRSGYWHPQIAPQQNLAFATWIDMVKKISFIRNDAAHHANVAPKAFQSLISMYFGGPMQGLGVFNGLLLAWRLPAQS